MFKKLKNKTILDNDVILGEHATAEENLLAKKINEISHNQKKIYERQIGNYYAILSGFFISTVVILGILFWIELFAEILRDNIVK